MKNKTILPAIIMAIGATLLASSPAQANDQCGSNIVVVDKKVGADFVSFPVRFRDQHTAEEFADQINSAPIVRNRAQQFTVRQKATVYAK